MGMLGRLREARRGARPPAPDRPLPPLVAARPPLFHPDVPVIVLWSEGAGAATALAWFLAQARLPGGTDLAALTGRSGYGAAVARALEERTRRVVKVVRDPPRRAAEAFLQMAGTGSGSPAWIDEEWRATDRWLAARGRDPARGASFLDHLERLAEEGARGARAAGAVAPQHLRGEDEVVDEVVPVERFALWACEGAAGLGLRPVQGGPAGAVAAQRPLALLGARPEAVPLRRGALAAGRAPDAAALLSDRTLPALRRAYAPDFAAYGALYGL